MTPAHVMLTKTLGTKVAWPAVYTSISTLVFRASTGTSHKVLHAAPQPTASNSATLLPHCSHIVPNSRARHGNSSASQDYFLHHFFSHCCVRTLDRNNFKGEGSLWLVAQRMQSITMGTQGMGYIGSALRKCRAGAGARLYS